MSFEARRTLLGIWWDPGCGHLDSGQHGGVRDVSVVVPAPNQALVGQVHQYVVVVALQSWNKTVELSAWQKQKVKQFTTFQSLMNTKLSQPRFWLSPLLVIFRQYLDHFNLNHKNHVVLRNNTSCVSSLKATTRSKLLITAQFRLLRRR